jgi:hypothetical protein
MSDNPSNIHRAVMFVRNKGVIVSKAQFQDLLDAYKLGFVTAEQCHGVMEIWSDSIVQRTRAYHRIGSVDSAAS